MENRSGGGTVIGTRAVATAPADGYTLGMVDTAFVINPGLLGSRLQYDTVKDFAPISLIATAPFVMVVHPSVKATDMASFVALAKADPGALSFGSAGVGSAPHLAGEQLRQQAGIKVVYVPYRGGGTVFTDLLGGQYGLAFATVPTLLEHIKAGPAARDRRHQSDTGSVPAGRADDDRGRLSRRGYRAAVRPGRPRGAFRRRSSTSWETPFPHPRARASCTTSWHPWVSCPWAARRRSSPRGSRRTLSGWKGVIQRGDIKPE